jgi:predicted nucleotidyltransferase
MAIPEQQLETWSHQGSTAQSAATYEAIRKVLEDPRAPYAGKKYRISLQGSYANDTNIRGAESDIDIAVCITSSNYYDLDNLSDAEKECFNSSLSPGGYSFKDFREELFAWLQANFGAGVKSGNKAIFVPGNGSRRDADVLPCFEHRRYMSFPSRAQATYREGICFWTKKGDKIVNYPVQHSDNGTSKHQATSSRFKPNVRVMKNIRNKLVDGGYIEDGTAPSYFLEGMLWNVTNGEFSSSYQETFLASMIWLEKSDHSKLKCGNGYHWLIRDGHQVCWNQGDFDSFRAGALQFWQDC